MSLKSLYGAPDSRFKLFHDLMPNKVEQILLVASTYDAWMMEEDCRFSERIISEYRGLNLSRPPRLHWVKSHAEALDALDRRSFDLVITMVGRLEKHITEFGQSLKRKCPQLPTILLCHHAASFQEETLTGSLTGFDDLFCWSGNTDLMVAMIKRVEDRRNIPADTQHAGIRVILMVEDSPVYISSLLPIFYRELVLQVQSVMEEGLNEEHRLLAMRARPKILVAGSYEEALGYYKQIEPYMLGVISDMRFPRNGRLTHRAGVDLLKKIHADRFDIPLLLISSQADIARVAAEIPAVYISKHSTTLLSEIHGFFINHLGFGPFVLRTPQGKRISQAANLRELEQQIAAIDQEAFAHHCNQNDFSRWFFARAEIEIADKVRPIDRHSFATIEKRRRNLLTIIRKRRMQRQKGLVVNLDSGTMDMDTDFFKIGKGSLGGKARGLAFVASILSRETSIAKKYPKVNISIPKTLVITTEGFDDFIYANDLKLLYKANLTDVEISDRFTQASLPQWITAKLASYLEQVTYPLAVRSSGLLEDAQSQAYAGLYKTYMLPNAAPDLKSRLQQLAQAVKLVYASTYYENPRRFAQRVGHRIEAEKMAVIVQQLIGQAHKGYFYPAVSGVAQSYNYYPFSKIKPQEGSATIVAGLGKTAMQGGRVLRFSPHYPQLLVQCNSVDEILKYSQTKYYALKMDSAATVLSTDEDATLEIRFIAQSAGEPPLNLLCSTYLPEEHRIRDTRSNQGFPVLTFANILKYERFPLASILKELLTIGQAAMGCPVEMEFCINFGVELNGQPDFAVLQLRPMGARQEQTTVEITSEDVKRALCYSTRALGNTQDEEITDIVYVKPDSFDVAGTRQVAREINRINAQLLMKNRRYLLIGPGRWGSSDVWLGIPVSWSDISAVGAIIETHMDKRRVDPSQGSHFFHNLISLGVPYLTVTDAGENFLRWEQLTGLPIMEKTHFVAHVHLNRPLILKVDGRTSLAAILLPST